MWKAQAGIAPSNAKSAAVDDADEWETEADYENTLDEKSKRLGGTQHHCVDMHSLRQQVQAGDQERITKAEKGYKHGFGGAFGVQKDRQDKSAANWEYKAEKSEHSSQKTDRPQVQAKSASVVAAMERISECGREEPVRKPVSSSSRVAAVTAKIAEAKKQFANTNVPTKKTFTPGKLHANNSQSPPTVTEFASRDADSSSVAQPENTGNDSAVTSAGDNEQPTMPVVSASVLYDYQKAADDEIDLEPGDIILNIRKLDEGWWYGENAKTGQTGLFPANYVQEQ